MSTIYGDLYQDLEPKRYTRGTEPDPLRLEAGLAFESFLEDAIRSRLCGGGRPDELTHVEPGIVTPILYNPDLIIFNSHIRVGEIKLTWMSSRMVPREAANSFPPKFEKYFTQMKSYCRCLETPYARLIGFFVMGDYQYYTDAAGDKKPCGPELLAWDIEFSKRELDENWAMMLNHARSKRML